MVSEHKGYGSNLDSETNLKRELKDLEPKERKVLILFLEHREGLTAQEISEIEHIDPESATGYLLQLRRKGLVYAVDEQGKDRIWRTKYFLKDGGYAAVKLLSDPVVVAVLNHIGKTDRCTGEELLHLDTIKEEFASLITELRTCGLIEIEEGEIILTKKGRKVLEHFEKLEEISK